MVSQLLIRPASAPTLVHDNGRWPPSVACPTSRKRWPSLSRCSHDDDGTKEAQRTSHLVPTHSVYRRRCSRRCHDEHNRWWNSYDDGSWSFRLTATCEFGRTWSVEWGRR